MFTCPTRAAPLFAAIASPTVPAPSPDCPLATLIHDALAAAVQWHPAIAATPTDRCPPAAAMLSFARDKVKTHGAACWLTGTVCCATTIDADRGAGAGLAATV
jgi:hypothetical protein